MRNTTSAIRVDEISQVSEARRQVLRLAGELQLDETDAGVLSIIVTELATNLVKHGGGGELLASLIPGESGIDIMTVDRGGGITSIEQSLRDGYSTAGSAGTGLGAVQRMATLLEIYSPDGRATVINARFIPKNDSPANSPVGFDIHGISVPYPGEDICGDGWDALSDNDRCTILVIDGLGHGIMAADASMAAIETFRRSTRLTPGIMMQQIHDRLRSTRGGVAAIARIDRVAGEIVYCGIGNISALVESPGGARRLVSMNGTLGGNIHRIQEFTYPFSRESLLVLNSDGLGTHWNVGDYPGLAAQSTRLVAGTLYRDQSRHRDDVTVVAVREAG